MTNLINFANKLEDENQDKDYKWMYDKLKYEIIKSLNDINNKFDDENLDELADDFECTLEEAMESSQAISLAKFGYKEGLKKASELI